MTIIKQNDPNINMGSKKSLDEDTGILFVASGEEYLKEVDIAVDTLRKHMPSIHVTLFSDREWENPSIDNIIVDTDLESGYSAKIKKMSDTPYGKTVFLDTDVKIADCFSEIFKLLDDFQMAFCHKNGAIIDRKVHDGFDMSYNTGVVAYRSDNEVLEFFENWLENYKSSNDYHDQPSFTLEIINSNIRYLTLPSEYNLRAQYCSVANSKVKIFHFRKSELPIWDRFNKVGRVMNKINSFEGRRSTYIGLIRIKLGRDKLRIIPKLRYIRRKIKYFTS
jgi:hypothetical protein